MRAKSAWTQNPASQKMPKVAESQKTKASSEGRIEAYPTKGGLEKGKAFSCLRGPSLGQQFS